MLAASFTIFIVRAGPKKSKWLVREFYFNKKRRLFCLISYLDIPWYLLIYGMILMLVSIGISMGGYYSKIVFGYTCVLIISGGLTFIWIYRRMSSIIGRKLK